MRDNKMKTHELKSWPEFFQPMFTGEKRFELRRNDRDYLPGDLLILREWEPREGGKYSGRTLYMLVTYVLSGAGIGCIEPLKGLALGYSILGVREVIPEHQIRPMPPDQIEQRGAA
jgi:hypothetical protein